MPKLPDEAVQAQRNLVIQAHLEAECITHDVDATVATFRHARYEIPALGTTADGPAAVHDLLTAVLDAFPDFYIRPVSYYDSETAVIVEAVLGGTQTGPWAAFPPSGKRMEVQSVFIFEFEGAQLVCEKIFFDYATLLRQIRTTN
ncbi:MAG TPA: ester cyclase [Acidobacteriaceae bacterium]|nr:ester cyclase [Acidobacteriaceae bacterium]